MAAKNVWGSFGLDAPAPPKPRRKWFGRIDTSRMSWMDCHIGYLLVATICLLICPIFEFTLFLALIAGLNGAYAFIFCQRSPGLVSRPIWWAALFSSVVFFYFLAFAEIASFFDGGRMETGALILFAIITKLTMGQLFFLFRIRRERRIHANT